PLDSFTSCMDHTLNNLRLFTSGYKNPTARIVRRIILPLFIPNAIKKIRAWLREMLDK
ncbi:unnamed protein product, partial [marine sediment metagenome]